MTEIAQWADVFPNLENQPTKDPRIFQTPWRKMNDDPESPKTKTYFACVVGGTCYGVEVIKPWARSAEKECVEAFNKVKLAVYHYEDHGEWPKDGVE